MAILTPVKISLRLKLIHPKTKQSVIPIIHTSLDYLVAPSLCKLCTCNYIQKYLATFYHWVRCCLAKSTLLKALKKNFFAT